LIRRAIPIVQPVTRRSIG